MSGVRFLHIPKTAGSTLLRILRQLYRGGGHFELHSDPTGDRNRFDALSEREQAAIVLVHGHSPIWTGIPSIDQLPIITLLRDPVDRVKSFCQHASEGKSQGLLSRFPPDRFDLDEFLFSGHPALFNLQTKMLIDTGTTTPSMLKQMSEQAAVDLALENLYTRVHAFGVQDWFDASLLVFSDALCWSTPFYVSLNVKDQHRLLDFKPHHLERIRELNGLDIVVHGSAKQRFEGILDDEEFRERLSVYQRSRQRVSPLLLIKWSIRHWAEARWREARGLLAGSPAVSGNERLG